MAKSQPGTRRRSPRDSDALAGDLRRVTGALVRSLRTKVPGQALSTSQGAVLRRLHDDGPTTVADLARSELVTPQAMGVMVAGLEEEGLVARTVDPTDARRWNAAVTEKGRRVLLEGRAAREAWLSKALREKLTEGERRQVAEALVVLMKIVGE